MFDSDEFEAAEAPGSADESTFYVTHLREPVSLQKYMRPDPTMLHILI
jgi:hypothetical protein